MQPRAKASVYLVTHPSELRELNLGRALDPCRVVERPGERPQCEREHAGACSSGLCTDDDGVADATLPRNSFAPFAQRPLGSIPTSASTWRVRGCTSVGSSPALATSNRSPGVLAKKMPPPFGFGPRCGCREKGRAAFRSWRPSRSQPFLRPARRPVRRPSSRIARTSSSGWPFGSSRLQSSR